MSEYDSFKSAIGYDIKGVTVRSWPPNTVCDAQCQIWYHKSVCTQLKWKLTARKREHKSLSATEKGQWSEATSKYPFDYLSPKSQQLKVQNMRRAIGDLNMLVKRTVSKIERLSLTDEQNFEISELVQSIQCSSEGQRNIYSEAEQSGEGRGSILRALWENDFSNMSQFVLDQKSNGNNYHTISLRVCTCTYSCSMCTYLLSLTLLPTHSSFYHIIHTHVYTSVVFSDMLLCQQVVCCYIRIGWFYSSQCSVIMISIAMAIFSRSPAAYHAVRYTWNTAITLRQNFERIHEATFNLSWY